MKVTFMTRRFAIHLLLIHQNYALGVEILDVLRRGRDAKYAALGAGVIFRRDWLDWELKSLEGFNRQLFLQTESGFREDAQDETFIRRWQELRAKTAVITFGARSLILAFEGHRASGALPRVAYRSIFEDWAGERPWTSAIRPSRIPESGSGITSVYQVQLLREYEQAFDRRIAQVSALNTELQALLREIRDRRVR